MVAEDDKEGERGGGQRTEDRGRQAPNPPSPTAMAGKDSIFNAQRPTPNFQRPTTNFQQPTTNNQERSNKELEKFTQGFNYFPTSSVAGPVPRVIEFLHGHIGQTTAAGPILEEVSSSYEGESDRVEGT